MVIVTVRQHGDIHLVEVHAQGFDVVLELIGVIAGVKENSLAVVPDKRRETPVQNRASLLVAEGVVEIQDRVLIGGGELAGWILRQQQERVTGEQQDDGTRDASHGDLRKIAANSITGSDDV